jgi:hypothetical protein
VTSQGGGASMPVSQWAALSHPASSLPKPLNP